MQYALAQARARQHRQGRGRHLRLARHRSRNVLARARARVGRLRRRRSLLRVAAAAGAARSSPASTLGIAMRSPCAASTGPRASPRRASNVVLVRRRPGASSRERARRRLHARAAPGQFPCRNLDFQSQIPLAQLSSRAGVGRERLGLRRLERQPRVRRLGPAQRHGDRRGHGSRESARGGHDSGQSVAVARGQGLPSVRRRRESLARVCLRADRSGQQRRADDRPVGAADDGGARVDEHGHGLAAHVVRLEHRLCDERRVAGHDAGALRRRQQSERRLVARLQPRESRLSAVREQRADDALHARLDEPRRHGRASGAVRAGPRSVRGARRFQRRSRRALGRHEQAAARAARHRDEPEQPLHSLRLADGQRFAPHLSRRARRDSARAPDADLHDRISPTCARPPCS